MANNAFELFVSYAHGDDSDGWISELIALIAEEHARFSPSPLRVFFDKSAIQSMDDWELRIIAGLRSSKLLIAILSDRYFASDYCHREWKWFVEHERTRRLPGEGIATIYAVTVPQFERASPESADAWLIDLNRRQYVDLRPWRKQGIDSLQDEEVRRRIQLLDQQISKKLDRMERIDRSPTTIPPHNPQFVGRLNELRAIREALIKGTFTALNGIPGIGKSALAFEYAHAYADEYPRGRFLAQCSGISDLRRVFVNIAAAIGIELSVEERNDLDACYSRVRAWLEEEPRTLLLLDNVDQPELLSQQNRSLYLPANDFLHVLVTTRMEAERFHGIDCVPLDSLPQVDAIRLLENHRPFDNDMERDAAHEIVRRLQGFSIAIEVIGVFLWQHSEISYVHYLKRLNEEGLGAVQGAGADPFVELSRHPQKLVGPLLIPTLESLSAPELLAVRFAALLSSELIPLQWLRDLVGRDYPEMIREPEPGYPDLWRQIERRIFGLRLLTWTDDPRLGRMHNILQEVTIEHLGDTQPLVLAEVLIEYVLSRAARFHDEWTRADQLWELMPLVACAYTLTDLKHPSSIFLALYLAPPLQAMAYHEWAHELLSEVIEITTPLGTSLDSLNAQLHSRLALVEQQLGNFTEAKRLVEKAIEFDKRAGSPDSTIAVRYNVLGMIEYDLGNIDRARELLENAVAVRNQAPPAESMDSYRDLGNLAVIHNTTGDNERARDMAQQALSLAEARHGTNHPDVATALSNLATIESSYGNFDEARKLLQRAINIDNSIFGDLHPANVRNYSNLAVIEAKAGDPDEARRLLNLAIAIKEKEHEAGHPDIAKLHQDMADLDIQTNQWAEARRHLRIALEILGRFVQENHPSVVDCMVTLAFVEQKLGQSDSARQLLRKVTCNSKTTEQSDWNHSVATVLNGFAVKEEQAGNLEKAKTYYQEAILRFEGAVKPGSLYIRLLGSLAMVELKLKNPDDAFQLIQRAISANQPEHEQDHDSFVQLYSVLGGVEHSRNNLQEARRWLRHAIAILRRQPILNERDYSESLSNLALVEEDLGNRDQARMMLQEVLDLELKHYGQNHPTTAMTYNNLGVLEQSAGRLKAARTYMRKAYRIQMDVQGAHHPQTKLLAEWLHRFDPKFRRK